MKIKILLSSLLILVSIFSYGQKNISEDKIESKNIEKEIFLSKKNTISVSPFNVLFKQIQFSYERRFGNKNSLMLVGSILHNRDAAMQYASGYTFGLAAELHYRKYVFNTKIKAKKNPKSQNVLGVYVAPFAGYQYLERDLSQEMYGYNGDYMGQWNEQSYQNAVQLGLVSGVNLNLLKGRISLDLYGGFAEKISFVGIPYSGIMNYPNSNSYRTGPGVLQFDVFGVIPKANLQLGFSF